MRCDARITTGRRVTIFGGEVDVHVQRRHRLVAPDVGNNGPRPAAVLAEVQAAGYTQVFRQGDVVILRSPDYSGPSAAYHPLGRGRG